MNRQGVVAALEAMRYPKDLRIGAETLADIIPDLDFSAMYPSFRYIDVEDWEREDAVLLLTDRALIRCAATSKGFESVTTGGRTRTRQDWRRTTLQTVQRRCVTGVSIETEEGPRSDGQAVQTLVRLTIDLDSGPLGSQLTLPYPHDLTGADDNDRDALHERLFTFAEAMITSLASASVTQR
jgi:hypothetical protein